MMRFLGWPEPRILDFLARQLDLGINSRGGPRDRNAVRVHAARLLLKIPVTTARPASSSRPVPGTAPRPALPPPSRAPFAARTPGPGRAAGDSASEPDRR